VKRSGRDESMWVVIHVCMEATLGISLYSYLYLKLAKTLCLFHYLLCFSHQKIRYKRTEEVLPRNWGRKRGRWAQTMYIHVNKCKNDKIKKITNRTKFSKSSLRERTKY
jgi:hypothetical protein